MGTRTYLYLFTLILVTLLMGYGLYDWLSGPQTVWGSRALAIGNILFAIFFWAFVFPKWWKAQPTYGKKGGNSPDPNTPSG